MLSKCVKESELKRELWIEVACNDLFGAGAGGMINPPDPKKMFSVKKAEIALFDRQVFDLFTDFEILYGMAKHLPETDPRNYEAMYLANHIINLMKVNAHFFQKETLINFIHLTDAARNSDQRSAKSDSEAFQPEKWRSSTQDIRIGTLPYRLCLALAVR